MGGGYEKERKDEEQWCEGRAGNDVWNQRNIKWLTMTIMMLNAWVHALHSMQQNHYRLVKDNVFLIDWSASTQRSQTSQVRAGKKESNHSCLLSISGRRERCSDDEVIKAVIIDVSSTQRPAKVTVQLLVHRTATIRVRLSTHWRNSWRNYCKDNCCCNRLFHGRVRILEWAREGRE